MKVVQTRTSRRRWAWFLGMVCLAVSLSLGLSEAQAAPEITSPIPVTTLTGSTETFSWTAGGSVVTEWWLYVGTSPGERDIYNSKSLGTATSDTVTVLPTNGATLYVRLWHRVNGEWSGTNFTYTAFASGGSSGGLTAVPPWDQNLPGAERFVVVMTGTVAHSAAVLDKETGLVWIQTPTPILYTWDEALVRCAREVAGDRLGWRLPSLHELSSLVNTDNPQGGIALPSGHPFNNILPTRYWTATTYSGDSNQAWTVNLVGGPIGPSNKTGPTKYAAWCVRGAGTLSVY